jgi:hypothetical protein
MMRVRNRPTAKATRAIAKRVSVVINASAREAQLAK